MKSSSVTLRFVALASFASLLSSSLVHGSGSDSLKIVVVGDYNLNSATSYGGTLPTATTDVEFSNQAYGSTPYYYNSSIAIGTLNDLDAMDTVYLDNTGSTASTVTLTSTQNNVSATSADVLYVATGAILNIGSKSTATINIFPSPSANLDVAGTLIIGSNGDLDLNSANTATVDGAGAVTLGGTISGTGGLKFAGTNAVSISGANTGFSGTTTLQSGVVTIGNASALGTGTISFSSGTLDASSASSLGNAISINTGITFGGSSSLTFTGAVTDQGGGKALTNSLSAGTATFSGNTITLSSASTGSSTRYITFGGIGTTVVSDQIVDGTGSSSIAKNGTGTLTLSGNNTYTGGTSISAGGIILGSGAALGTGTLTVTNLDTLGDSVALTGANAVVNNIVLTNAGSTPGLTITPTYNLTLSGAITPTGTSATYGVIKDTGAAQLNLYGANAYGGGTTISGGGVLSANTIANGGNMPTITTTAGSNTAMVNSATGLAVGQAIYGNASIPAGTTIAAISGTTITLSSGTGVTAGTSVTSVVGTANSLGLSSNAAGNLVISNNSTLQYTGAAASTDRLFQVGGTVAGDTATIDASGTGAVDFTNTGAVTYGSNNQARTLILTGSNTGNNTLTPVVATNGTGTVSLTKSGVGTWVLAGANTYTGTTTINSGQLYVTNGSGSGTGTGAVTLGTNSGVAALGGTGKVSGAVIATTTGTNVAHLDPGVNSSGYTGTAGTLSLGSAGLTLNDGTELDYDLNTTTTAGGGTNDLLTMSDGTLTIGSGSDGKITFNFNELGGSLSTTGSYTLISGASTINGFNSGDDITTKGDSGYTASYSVGGGDLYVSFSLSTPAAAYFNGNTSSDLNTASNFYTTAMGSTTVSSPVGATTDVFITSNNGTTGSNALTPTLNTGSLTVNSLTFTGTGTPATAGLTLSGTSTLTIAAGTGTYTAGRGITLLTGAGHDTISAPVALGASQTFFVTDSTGTLSVTGNLSDGGNGYALTTGGVGTVALSGSNTYSGGTTVTAGTQLAIFNPVASPTAHSAGSQTGYGSVAVNGTLSGNGTVAPTTGSGVVIGAGGSFRSGVAGSTSTGAYTGAYLNNAANLARILTVSGTGTSTMSANLTFALGAGNNTLTEAPATPYNEANPNTDTTYLTVSGSASSPTTGNGGEINFSGTDSVTLQDLTSGQLTLREGVPYLLIQAGSTPNIAADDYLYSGLVTSLNGSTNDLQMDGNGFVLGVGTTASYTAVGINEVDINGNPLTGSAVYQGPILYLDDGDLEVVPEPSTWAMMLAGLGVLLLAQRMLRRTKH